MHMDLICISVQRTLTAAVRTSDLEELILTAPIKSWQDGLRNATCWHQ